MYSGIDNWMLVSVGGHDLIFLELDTLDAIRYPFPRLRFIKVLRYSFRILHNCWRQLDVHWQDRFERDPFFFEATVDHRDTVTGLGYPRFDTTSRGAINLNSPVQQTYLLISKVQGPEMLILPDERDRMGQYQSDEWKWATPTIVRKSLVSCTKNLKKMFEGHLDPNLYFENIFMLKKNS